MMQYLVRDSSASIKSFLPDIIAFSLSLVSIINQVGVCALMTAPTDLYYAISYILRTSTATTHSLSHSLTYSLTHSLTHSHSNPHIRSQQEASEGHAVLYSLLRSILLNNWRFFFPGKALRQLPGEPLKVCMHFIVMMLMVMMVVIRIFIAHKE